MSLNSLDNCFADYREKQSFLKDIADDTNYGRSFACFATSVILHSIPKKKQKLADIKVFWSDSSGDGKIDGIAFAIDGMIVYHAKQVEEMTDLHKIELYFIQSKKRKNEPFNKKDFEDFSKGVESFVIDGKILDTRPSSAMKQWSILLSAVKAKCKKLQGNQKPEFFIHLYYATWLAKPILHNFKREEHYFKNEIENEFFDKFNCEAKMRFHWADGEYLRKHYVRNLEKTDNLLKATNPHQWQDENAVLILWDTGVVTRISENLNGIIDSRKYGKVFFRADNIANESVILKIGDEVKFQIVRNPDLLSDVKWCVCGKSLQLV